MEYNFKKGDYKLNSQNNFDFQLNRIVMWESHIAGKDKAEEGDSR